MNYYDKEFDACLLRAKEILMKMESKEDQKICSKWIERLFKLQSQNMEVKKNRNIFFQFMLRVLEDGNLAESFLSKPGEKDYLPFYTGDEEEDSHVMNHWSEDGRTYTSIKTLPNSGAIIYMAVSSDPEAGWDHPPKSY